MSPAEAAEAVKIEVQEINERVVQQMNAKLPMASNFLRNAEIDVLSGNPSPSAPGAVPGTVTGNLMRTWTPFYTSGGAAGVFELQVERTMPDIWSMAPIRWQRVHM